MQIGILGLGKMGSRIAEKLLQEGHHVVGWNRSKDILNTSIEDFTRAATIKDLVHILKPPRIVWLMLPAGDPTQTVLDEVSNSLDPEDIIIDGGNAFYKDTEWRSRELKGKGIRFLGVGVSGGIKAFGAGYPLMVGGDQSAYEYLTPLLDSLSNPHGGHTYFGEGGAGHFVKMVHNGIEYGMMQAIGEGFGVLEKAPYQFDLRKVAQLWQKNTIIASFLIDSAKDALDKNATLSDIDGVIDATGEAEWTVNQAKEEGVPIENIEQSVEFRKRSKVDAPISSSFAARMVAALRREFGGHKVKVKH